MPTIRQTVRRLVEFKDSSDFDVETLKITHPKTFKHLMKQSREAEANTGEPDGEYGTYHHIASLHASKQKRELDHALVHHVATSLGPDMAYERTGRLTAQVRKSAGDILDAFENGKLSAHVEKLVSGPKSDRYRHDGDKYF